MTQGQLSLFDSSKKVPEHEQTEQNTINFSCFASFRSEAGGVRYGECVGNHHCTDCEAHIRFYEKAEEYQKAGNPWGLSVALAHRFFGIPVAPEYDVEAYQQKFTH